MLTIINNNEIRNLDGLGQEELDRILFEAIDYGNFELASSAIKAGANINPQFTKSTPLINALKWHNSDIVYLLLYHPDIDINLTDIAGLRAIDYAYNFQIALLLLRMGAAPSFKGGRLSSFEAEELIKYLWDEYGLRKELELRNYKSINNTEAKNE